MKLSQKVRMRRGSAIWLHLCNAVGIAVRIGHGSAIMDGQVLRINFLQQSLGPLRGSAASDDSDFIGRGFVEERPDDGKRQIEDSRS